MHASIALPVLADGDAIGHDVLGMAAALRSAGHRATLYAEKSLVAEEVLPLESLVNSQASRDDLLIYHHSHGCEAGVRAVRSWPGRAAVKYHNVTPPRFFANANPAVYEAAESGLSQANELAKAVPFWCDSAFNGEGLPTGSWKELPPFMPTESLIQLDAEAGFASMLDDWTTTLLCVGRVAPNKNLLLAIDAFADYRQRYERQSRLLIAGGHVFPEYSEAVQERIRERGLSDCVAITGRVTPSQLKALYLAADALLVTSEHEGFCVPLVEAMALHVPTVAVPTTAIPGTAGPFARYAEPNASAIADALHELIDDGIAREKHLRDGQVRYSNRFTTESIRRQFLELVASL